MRESGLTGVTSSCVRCLRGQPVGKHFILFALPSGLVSAAFGKHTSESSWSPLRRSSARVSLSLVGTRGRLGQLCCVVSSSVVSGANARMLSDDLAWPQIRAI